MSYQCILKRMMGIWLFSYCWNGKINIFWFVDFWIVLTTLLVWLFYFRSITVLWASSVTLSLYFPPLQKNTMYFLSTTLSAISSAKGSNFAWSSTSATNSNARFKQIVFYFSFMTRHFVYSVLFQFWMLRGLMSSKVVSVPTRCSMRRLLNASF